MDNDQNKIYNEIDLECNYIDDDIDTLNIRDSSTGENIVEDISDVRGPVRTGILIDLSDDDIQPRKQLRTISADLDNSDNLVISKNFNSDMDEFEPKDFNEIDMETDCCEDDDFESIKKPTSEEILIENAIDAEDYWEKLQKKYKKKNKLNKGIHTHFAGDPEKEIKMFNGETVANNSDSYMFSDIAGADSGTATSGESVSEELIPEPENNWSKKLHDLLDYIGFEIIENSDKSLTAIDLLDDKNSTSIICKDRSELFGKLKPYIDDCIIYPLQVATGKDMAGYEDWINWYKEDENRKKYPEYADEIDCCELLLNHLNECEF